MLLQKIKSELKCPVVYSIHTMMPVTEYALPDVPLCSLTAAPSLLSVGADTIHNPNYVK